AELVIKADADNVKACSVEGGRERRGRRNRISFGANRADRGAAAQTRKQIFAFYAYVVRQRILKPASCGPTSGHPRRTTKKAVGSAHTVETKPSDGGINSGLSVKGDI